MRADRNAQRALQFLVLRVGQTKRREGVAHLTAKADLQGSVEFDWRPEGLLATIRFPIAG